MISANEKIQNHTIRHMVFLERLKINQIRLLRKILDDEILPDIIEKIEKRLKRISGRGYDPGADTTARLKQLEKEISELSAALAVRVKEYAIADIKTIVRDEIDWQDSVIRDAVGFNIETVVPSSRAVAGLVKRSSFAGLKLDDWFETLERSTQKNIMKAVNRGIVEGETTDEIMRRIRGTKALSYTDGVLQTTRAQAEAVTRTVINHTSNMARNEFFLENADILKGVKWITTLDSRTSTVCAGLDGKVFPIDKGPRPPAHPNCRSSITGILKDAEEMGLNEIPAGKRASINGQVPDTVTYGEWLRGQPVSVQDAVLGVKKSKLFRDGQLPIERFSDSNLKPLNLEQLRRLEKKAFEVAGL
jgi:SPP1 gp7 family putative phage head morphogenesis protein